MRRTGSPTAAAAADATGKEVARLYGEQRDRLRRLAYLMIGHREAAEEIVQDAFARSHRRWESIDSPAAYLRASVVNLCMDWRRRAALERERTPRPPDEAVAPPEVDETWALLARLPQDQRVTLVLRYYEDLSVDEVARVMACPPATVRTRAHRALHRLREEMTP